MPRLTPLVLALAIATATASAVSAATDNDRLIGQALLEADPAFEKLPVAGFTALATNPDGSFWALPAPRGGLASEEPLVIYKVRADFAAAGRLRVESRLPLTDPGRQLPFILTHTFTPERALTRADLEPASLVQAPDGTFWLGDQAGPMLVRLDAQGRVMEPPHGLPDPERGGELRSPRHPGYEEAVGTRFMNAMRAHARAHGGHRPPVFAPFHLMIADGDPKTQSPGRIHPFLPQEGSEIYDPAALRAAGHPTVPWTVNTAPELAALMQVGVDGLISDAPDVLLAVVRAHDADGDGKPGDLITPEGLIDRSRFDAQGHRGARSLRPENTLPSFEAGLDHLMTTLESDCTVTRDGVVMLNHESHVGDNMARRIDRRPLRGHKAFMAMTAHEIQSTYLFDRLQPLFPRQERDRKLSPVAVAFAQAHGLADPYVMPTLGQLFDFTRFYARYYRYGAGRHHPEARARAKNAESVRFDIETKTSPAHQALKLTPEPRTFARLVADTAVSHGVVDRTQVQSFDYRTLLVIQEQYPRIQTVFLTSEIVPWAMRQAGTAASAERRDLWEGELPWPHRVTHVGTPPRVAEGGGLAGLALAPEGDRLYAMLARPLAGSGSRTAWAYEFDMKARRYTGKRHAYPLEAEGGQAVGLTMLSREEGLVIERSGGAERVFRTRFAAGEPVRKAAVTDLTRFAGGAGYNGLAVVGPQRLLVSEAGARGRQASFKLLQLAEPLE